MKVNHVANTSVIPSILCGDTVCSLLRNQTIPLQFFNCLFFPSVSFVFPVLLCLLLPRSAEFSCFSTALIFLLLFLPAFIELYSWKTDTNAAPISLQRSDYHTTVNEGLWKCHQRGRILTHTRRVVTLWYPLCVLLYSDEANRVLCLADELRGNSYKALIILKAIYIYNNMNTNKISLPSRCNISSVSYLHYVLISGIHFIFKVDTDTQLVCLPSVHLLAEYWHPLRLCVYVFSCISTRLTHAGAAFCSMCADDDGWTRENHHTRTTQPGVPHFWPSSGRQSRRHRTQNQSRTRKSFILPG